MTSQTTASTPAPTTGPTSRPAIAAAATALPPRGRVLLAHTKALTLDLLRTPIAIVSAVAFPTLVFAFFVVPQGSVTADPIMSLVSVAQLAVFGVMSAYLFGFGIGVAEDRANPWTTYMRTLPVGPMPTTLARFLTAAFSAGLSLVPLVIAAGLLTSAPQAFTSGDLSWARIPLALLTILLAATPFLGLGLAIGYLMSSKAAVAVAQLVNFPLAFIGGLMLPPEMFPNWLNALSLATPARSARDLVAGVLTGEPIPASTVPVTVGWAIVLVALAVWANRRDEGRRFR